jgi:phosphotransferase system HPr-like phosphotransfer protein
MEPKDLTPAELKAVEEHKYYMSEKLKREVTIEEAIEDFMKGYREAWLKDKVKKDNLAQMEEINKHKYIKSKEAGRDLSHEAVEEWKEKYAPTWRQERESLERNGIKPLVITIKSDKGLHVKPSCTLYGIARKYNCDLYISTEKLEHYNFKLNGKPFLNMRSLLSALDLVAMCISKGEKIEFIAYGEHAAQVIEEIRACAEVNFEGKKVQKD